MSGAYVTRFLQTSSGGRSNCPSSGVWDPWGGDESKNSQGGAYSCYKPCPSNFPYPSKDKCYQYPVDYNPNPPASPPPATSTAPPVNGPVNPYSPPNPASNNNSNNDNHGGNTTNTSPSVGPTDAHQTQYNNSAGYNDVFYSDPGVTGAPADVGAGADSGSSSGGMDTNTMLLIGGLAIAGILAVKMMKK